MTSARQAPFRDRVKGSMRRAVVPGMWGFIPLTGGRITPAQADPGNLDEIRLNAGIGPIELLLF